MWLFIVLICRMINTKQKSCRTLYNRSKKEKKTRTKRLKSNEGKMRAKTKISQQSSNFQHSKVSSNSSLSQKVNGQEMTHSVLQRKEIRLSLKSFHNFQKTKLLRKLQEKKTLCLVHFLQRKPLMQKKNPLFRKFSKQSNQRLKFLNSSTTLKAQKSRFLISQQPVTGQCQLRQK